MHSVANTLSGRIGTPSMRSGPPTRGGTNSPRQSQSYAVFEGKKGRQDGRVEVSYPTPSWLVLPVGTKHAAPRGGSIKNGTHIPFRRGDPKLRRRRLTIARIEIRTEDRSGQPRCWSPRNRSTSLAQVSAPCAVSPDPTGAATLGKPLIRECLFHPANETLSILLGSGLCVAREPRLPRIRLEQGRNPSGKAWLHPQIELIP